MQHNRRQADARGTTFSSSLSRVTEGYSMTVQQGGDFVQEFDTERATPEGDAPSLSVTVLNYNYARYLPECLNSILSQTFKDFEVILIDDCSKDNSQHVIEPYLADPRVRPIYHNPNVGFVGSLLEGVQKSRGRYITVISADDFILTPTAFERQMRLLESRPSSSFGYAAWQYVDATSRAIDLVRPWADDHIWSGEEEFRAFCTRFYVLHTGTIIRRTAYDAVGGYDSSIVYTLDNTIWAQLCGVGDVAYVSEPSYGYRTHGVNMSHSVGALQATVDEFVRLIDLGFARLPEGRTKRDSVLRHQARQAALAGVPTMQIFANNYRAGWTAIAYAARHYPADTLLQPRILSLAARTVLGTRGYSRLRSLFKALRSR